MIDKNKKIAISNRPFWTERVSGDAVVFQQFGHRILFSIIDGTGHGEEAHAIASKMANYLESLTECQCPDKVIESLHKYSEPSIGASVGVAIIDTKEQRIEFSGVGNISAYVLGQEDHSFSSSNGAVGVQIRNIYKENRGLLAGDILLMHSDGIKSRFYTQYEPEYLKQSVNQILSYIFTNFGKKHDDASCLVYRY